MVRSLLVVGRSIADNIAGSAPSDDDMDMEFADDFRVPQHPPRKAYEVEHESLSQQAVEKLMTTDVNHISSIFGVNVRMNIVTLYFMLIIIFSIRRKVRPRCCCIT
jgi:hypothetical protein